jgi:DNA-binding MarR family transcriptional regulator
VEQWREILVVHARTLCEPDRALHRHGLCASDFEVLDVLAAGAGVSVDGGPAYRVQEIAERVRLSRSALSRLIARLAGDGLVERCPCPEDRRGARVSLTAKGRDLHGRVLPLRRAVLERMPADGPRDRGTPAGPQD